MLATPDVVIIDNKKIFLPALLFLCDCLYCYFNFPCHHHHQLAAASGPKFCAIESSEEDFCRNGGDVGVGERSCGSKEVCTSSCQCWNGNEIVSTDTGSFTGTGIEDQGRKFNF